MRSTLAFFLVFSVSHLVHASVNYRMALSKKTNEYMEEGVITGGEAIRGSILMDLQRIYSAKSKMDRVVIDIGAMSPGESLREMGYFHVSVEKKPARIVIDLPHVKALGKSLEDFHKAFYTSPFIDKYRLIANPVDSSMQILLELRRPVSVEVFQVLTSGKNPRLVLDLKG